MQKAFDLIKERLEEEINDVIVKDTYSKGKNAGLRKAKIIVNQVAEEYKHVTTCYFQNPCEYQNEDIDVEGANEELMKNLIEAKKNCGEDSDCSECIFGQKEDNCYLQELQINGSNDGWIPCEKKLPKDGVVVDLSCKYMGIYYETVGYLKNGNRGHSYIVDNDVFMRSAVLAWRKRPAPYQPKGE